MNIMGHSYSRGQKQGQVEATHYWPYPPLGGKKLLGDPGAVGQGGTK